MTPPTTPPPAPSWLSYLPTASQVNAATRHAGSFAAGAIAMFGISTKISPEQVAAIINSAGNLVNDAVLFAGLVAPFITGYFASKSASPKAQLAAVVANPDVVGVVTKPTAEGVALAQSVPGPVVSVAGSNAAKSLAAGN